jgi:Insecticide toxin TcdB middle/C-terminal region
LTAAQIAAITLADSALPGDVYLADGTRANFDFSPEEYREACRALRGTVLRREVYALDGSTAQARPYTVSESNYTIESFQPQGPNQYGVFFAHPRESVDFQYERDVYAVVGDTLAGSPPPAGAVTATDPRVKHTQTLAADPYGNPLEVVTAGYGRRYLDPALSPADQATQNATLTSYIEATFTNAVLDQDAYRAPAPAQANSYQIIQAQPSSSVAGVTNLFGFDELAAIVAGLAGGANDLPYEDLNPAGLTAGTVYRRLISWLRVYYRPDDLGAAAGNAKALLALGVNPHAQGAKGRVCRWERGAFPPWPPTNGTGRRKSQ